MISKGVKLTVGELKSRLEMFDENDEIYFSGLDFYRLKKRGPSLAQVEFNQTVYVESDDLVKIENNE